MLNFISQEKKVPAVLVQVCFLVYCFYGVSSSNNDHFFHWTWVLLVNNLPFPKKVVVCFFFFLHENFKLQLPTHNSASHYMGGFSRRIYKRELCKHEDGHSFPAGVNLSSHLQTPQLRLAVCTSPSDYCGENHAALWTWEVFFLSHLEVRDWRWVSFASWQLAERAAVFKMFNIFFKGKNLEVPPWFHKNKKQSDSVVQPRSCGREAGGGRHVTLALTWAPQLVQEQLIMIERGAAVSVWGPILVTAMLERDFYNCGVRWLEGNTQLLHQWYSINTFFFLMCS